MQLHCAKFQGDKCYLTLYAVALGAFVFFYMSGAIWVSVQDVESEIEKPLNESLKKYVDDVIDTTELYRSVEIGDKLVWDKVMEQVRTKIAFKHKLKF